MSQQYSFPVGLAAQWRKPDTIKLPNAQLADWLLNTGSLTERLQSACANFSVELIGQEKVTRGSSDSFKVSLHPDESDGLVDLKQGDWQVREVVLLGDGKPWVFARSVLPDELCTTQWQGLGNQPLGQRIFNDKSFVRSDFLVSKLAQNPLDCLQKTNLWARRSSFSINQYSLLVAEVFLPDCPCYHQE